MTQELGGGMTLAGLAGGGCDGMAGGETIADAGTLTAVGCGKPLDCSTQELGGDILTGAGVVGGATGVGGLEMGSDPGATCWVHT